MKREKRWPVGQNLPLSKWGVSVTRDETTVVIRDVPAQIYTTCGEEYVDAATGKRLAQIAETAVSEGVQVDVRRYKAA
jgi:hypothetical protein